MNRKVRILTLALFLLVLVAVTRDLVHGATAAADPILVGAGDIANCGGTSPSETKAEATARLLDALPEATIFTTGDNAYSSGTEAQFRDCYDPTWGRHKGRTRPSPGNHDYTTAGAAPYYAYFGDRAGPAGTGYYSYDLGAWLSISLNSIQDNGSTGQVIIIKPGHWGVRNMQERARAVGGRLEFRREPYGGTTVVLVFAAEFATASV